MKDVYQEPIVFIRKNARARDRDTYKEVRTFYREGAVVRVHIPDLTEEERARRMREIEKAAEQLLASNRKS